MTLSMDATDNSSPASESSLGAKDSKLLDQVKAILRRDLKLGPSETIADDMPLIGGNTPLDSIDILLLLSSFEQELGVRIADEDVGKDVFANVLTLTNYIEKHQGSGEAKPAKAKEDIVDWRNRLPHGDEFIFISQVHQLEPQKQCTATWSLSGEEWFFKPHFPDKPLVPGVLVIEALAQCAGLACVTGDDKTKGAVIAQSDIKFAMPICPPVDIQLKAEVSRSANSLKVCEVAATVDGQVAVRGTILLHSS